MLFECFVVANEGEEVSTDLKHFEETHFLHKTIDLFQNVKKGQYTLYKLMRRKIVMIFKRELLKIVNELMSIKKLSWKV